MDSLKSLHKSNSQNWYNKYGVKCILLYFSLALYYIQYVYWYNFSLFDIILSYEIMLLDATAAASLSNLEDYKGNLSLPNLTMKRLL